MADKKKIQYKAGVLGGVTQEQADKKNAEQTTPTAPQTEPTAPQTAPQEQSGVAAMLEANNARLMQKQAKVQAMQEAEAQRVQTLRDLREKKGSFIGNYLTAIEPKVDKNKEKRLQQAAKMKLLHDGLSALAKAYPAFIGKNAMGYYPTSTPSNIGKDIEELNAMREAYIKERKAWQDLGERYKVAQLDEQIASAEAALKTAQEAKAQANKDLDKAEDDYLDDLRYLDEQSRADARAKSRNDATVKAAQIRATNAKKDGKKGKDDIDHEALAFWSVARPSDFSETSEHWVEVRDKYGMPMLDENGEPTYKKSYKEIPRNFTKDEYGVYLADGTRKDLYQTAQALSKQYNISMAEIARIYKGIMEDGGYSDLSQITEEDIIEAVARKIK